jgi:hypothetical protein
MFGRELDEVTHKQLARACQDNPWLKVGGIDFEDDPFMENDYGYEFTEFDSIEELEEFFDHGNWAIRQGAVYKDLAFINQVNGGDEWWTLKNFDGEWIDFESITFRGIIKRGDFPDYIESLLGAWIENGRVEYDYYSKRRSS